MKSKEQMKEEWIKSRLAISSTSEEDAERIADWWLSKLSLREQELWDKCEEMKKEKQATQGITLRTEIDDTLIDVHNQALSDIQSLLKK